jgi:hypothetical protein
VTARRARARKPKAAAKPKTRKPSTKALVARAAKALGVPVVELDLPPVEHRVYVLRSCDSDMRAHGGFKWPESGYLSAPDWKPEAVCGYGLHGLAWGEGSMSLCGDVTPGVRRWLVVVADAREIVSLGDKVKFPRAWVEGVYASPKDAMLVIDKHAPKERAGRSGNYGTASAGDGGTASAGYRGTASAGVGGTASAGDGGTASAGDGGTASAGYRGTASAGNYGTASAGVGGTASAGNYGTASAGVGGTASAGVGGTASAGNYGTASAGVGGTVSILFYDPTCGSYRRRCAEVSSNGPIKPNVKYRINFCEFVEVGK